jgi:protocatechuate 3,4-dioxygenase beta subunit
MVRGFVLIPAAVLLLSAFLCAQSQSKDKKVEDASASRTLTGAVFDKAGHTVPSAVVYLKNTRNLTIHTYITGNDGAYRFNNLSPDIDYQVRAESSGHKSAVKTLSSYAARKQPHINLHLGK